MYPPYLPVSHAPALYTYYVFMSLLVIMLAVSLMWLPFMQLIVEANTIISKTLVYANKEVLGNPECLHLNQLAFFFKSQEALILIAVICLTYLFYLAFSDFLIFADNYFYSLPGDQVEKLKIKLKNYGQPRVILKNK